MKQCAIILNGSDVVKVSNLKRKYNKLINNPDIKILEECEIDDLENRYEYWNDITKEKSLEQDLNIKRFYFRNKINGDTITSIYPTLNGIPNINIEDWIKY